MRLRPNGGITVCGLRWVSSVTIAISSLRSYLPLRSLSSGPIVPGRSPPLITWQVRQLPLPRSKAIFCPSATDCAYAEAADSDSANMAAIADGMGWRIKGVSGGDFLLEYKESKAQRPSSGNPDYRSLIGVKICCSGCRARRCGVLDGGTCGGIWRVRRGRIRRPARRTRLPPQPPADLGGAGKVPFRQIR